MNKNALKIKSRSKEKRILDSIKTYRIIRYISTRLSYLLIIISIGVYLFYTSSAQESIKVVNKYKDSNKNDYQLEKFMINPRIKFQYKESDIYDIKASKAVYDNDHNAMLFEVSAKGLIGEIVAGELRIQEDGNHLIFSKKPVLIINKSINEQ